MNIVLTVFSKEDLAVQAKEIRRMIDCDWSLKEIKERMEK